MRMYLWRLLTAFWIRFLSREGSHGYSQATSTQGNKVSFTFREFLFCWWCLGDEELWQGSLVTCSCAVALQHTVHSSTSGKGSLPRGVAVRGCSHMTKKVNIDLQMTSICWSWLKKNCTCVQTPKLPLLLGPQNTLYALLETSSDSANFSEDTWGSTQLKHMIKDLNESISIEI